MFEEVLIPVTRFFREPDSFEALTTTILPRLMANRPPGTPFRVWVPGCASGEEAYSIAICLLEFLGTAADEVPIKIFATDISDRAVETARSGSYGANIEAEVSTRRLQRFFVRSEQGYQVNKVLRDLCVFARHDLTSDPPFSQLDLMSCRNVLIYFDSVLQGRALSVFHYGLKPGGILILGSSETVGGHTELFEAVDRKHKLYQRTSISSRLIFDYRTGTTAQPQLAGAGGTVPGHGVADVFQDVDRAIMARYAPSGVVVDESLRIIQFRGDTGPYLKPAPGLPTTELLLMAREGLLGDLRNTFERVRRDNRPVRTEGVRVKTNDHFEEIDIEVIPVVDPVLATRHFAVLFENPRRADRESRGHGANRSRRG